MRETRCFNNNWKFKYGEWEAVDVSVAQERMNDTWADVGLPHSFGIPYFMENEFYVGYGTYSKVFQLSPEDLAKRILLEFLGVFQVAEVFLNGEAVGGHRGGYTAFVLDLTDRCRIGDNILHVKVNNLWDARLAPRGGEHQFNGGIYRDVSLILTARTCVEWMGTFVKTKELQGEAAVLEVETEIYLGEDFEEVELLSEILYPGKVAEAVTLVIKPGKAADGAKIHRDSFRKNIEQVKPWSPNRPALYTLRSTVKVKGETRDIYETKFGIRTVCFDQKKGFFLNGEHLEVHGTNVHQDHAGWADAVTRSGITRDIQLIKDCGMNFIRGSHYPHHPFFAKECDRIGVLFWSEMCFWGTSGDHRDGYWTASAYPIREEDEGPFEESCLTGLEEMIRTNRNSPSLIIWSVCNEPFFSARQVIAQARALVVKMVDRVHRLDDTRPAAVGGAQRGGFDALGDVAGYNGDGASLYREPDFPSFVSEYGSTVSGRPGEYCHRYLDGVEERPEWRSGMALWCGFHHGSIIGNMGAMGIIDYYRVPLLAWYWYRNELRGIPRPVSRQEGIPAKLKLTADRYVMTADGREDAYLSVEVLDAGGLPLSNELTVTLEVVEGDGIFPTGKKIILSPEQNSFLDGQGAIEFRSYYGGRNVIIAQAAATDGSRKEITVRAAETDGGQNVAAAQVAGDRIEIVVNGKKRTGKLVPMVPPPKLTGAPKHSVAFIISENKPVFSSGYLPEHLPAYIAMGDNRYWKPQQKENAWVALDLEGEREVQEIQLWVAGEALSAQLTIEVSGDGKVYHPLALGFEDGCYRIRETVKSRFIKVNLPDTMEGIKEIRVLQSALAGEVTF